MAFSGNCRESNRRAVSNLVSVIVPNHGRDLTALRNSLFASKYKKWELIVVDEGLERSAQRNIGINRANGKYILILDSDQSISPNLMHECVSALDDGYTCAYIPEVIVADSLFGRIRAFEREFYTGTAVDVPRFVLAKACPMFDTEMSGPEDADWGNRIKGCRYTSMNVLYHHDDIPMMEYFKKKAYYTKSMKKYAEKWKSDKVLSPKYRCWDVFVENGKWKKILRHPFLFMGIIFIIIVRAFIYVKNK